MRITRILMGTLYIVAGVGHFIATRRYESIMPDYLPAHRELVLISGAAEIAGGAGLLVPQTRRTAAWGIVILLIAVMPANLWMAQHPERVNLTSHLSTLSLPISWLATSRWNGLRRRAG